MRDERIRKSCIKIYVQCVIIHPPYIAVKLCTHCIHIHVMVSKGRKARLPYFSYFLVLREYGSLSFSCLDGKCSIKRCYTFLYQKYAAYDQPLIKQSLPLKYCQLDKNEKLFSESSLWYILQMDTAFQISDQL